MVKYLRSHSRSVQRWGKELKNQILSSDVGLHFQKSCAFPQADFRCGIWINQEAVFGRLDRVASAPVQMSIGHVAYDY